MRKIVRGIESREEPQKVALKRDVRHHIKRGKVKVFTRAEIDEYTRDQEKKKEYRLLKQEKEHEANRLTDKFFLKVKFQKEEDSRMKKMVDDRDWRDLEEVDEGESQDTEISDSDLIKCSCGEPLSIHEWKYLAIMKRTYTVSFNYPAL